MSPRTLFRAIALSLLAGVEAYAAEPPPELLRQRAEAFAAAIRAPQGEALANFVRDHLETRLSREGLVDRLVANLRAGLAELGAVEEHRVRLLPDGRTVFVYCRHTKAGSWQNYQFMVLPDDGYRLQLVFRAIALEPADPPHAPLGSPEATTYLTRRQEVLEREQPFSGIALVRQRGKETYRWINGLADAPAKLPVTREHRFSMASGSKMFTAVAILQLAQAGKLKLSDSLAQYLPDFPNQDFARRATLHQLLTHTAGAGNYWDESYEKAWHTITQLRQMVPFVLPHLAAEAPSEFTYSNSGYVLLGLVIEAVSGKSFYDYMAQQIFAPAGMTATGYPLRAESTHLVNTYLPEMEAGAVKLGVYRPSQLGARGTSAGGASTTVDDLLRFTDALTQGKLLDPAHLALLTHAHISQGPPGSDYGYGTIVETKNGVRSFGHGGMAPGVQFEFKIYPQLDTVLVVMSNYDTIAGPELATTLDGLIRQRGPAAPPPSIPGS